MSTYVSKTSVTSEKSRVEIERTLTRWGATQFAYGWNGDGTAMVGFMMNDRQVRFVLNLPPIDDFKRTPKTRETRTPEGARVAWEQACRQRWRALALVVKAKLEAVESGISEFESEFMAQIVLPNGSTVGEFMAPQIEQAYLTNEMPPMLAIGTGE